MTTLAAMRCPETGDVVLGADSAVTGEHKYTLRTQKIFRAGKLALAVSGVLPPFVEYPKLDACMEHARILAALFIESLKEAGHGTSLQEEGGIQVYPIGAIIAGQGIGPLSLSATGDLWEPADGYYATGSGAGPALGVLAFNALMHRKKGVYIDAKDVVRTAIEVSKLHDPNTGGPVNLVHWRHRG